MLYYFAVIIWFRIYLDILITAKDKTNEE